MFKKAQAAMEFLMTYGWAILVVLAAIGALAYFGVLSPDRFLPEKCTLPSGMACLDFKQNGADGIQIIIQNSGGFDMQSMNITLGPNITTNVCTSVTPNATSLTDGTKATFTAAGCTLTQGKFKTNLYVTYLNGQTELTHTKSGELIMKVE